MTVLDKIKAFFKWPKPEAKAAEKKETEPPETKEIIKSKRGKKGGGVRCLDCNRGQRPALEGG